MTGTSPQFETANTWHLRSQDFAAALLDAEKETPGGVGKAGNPANKRFAVYRNNVIVSLIDSLKASFPSVHTVMGEENFIRVAGIFCRMSPPASPMMQHYGDEFPGFLAGFRPLAKSPFIAELATVERAFVDAFHALDAQPLDASGLAVLSPEETLALKLQPHPAASVHSSAFPIFDLFEARSQWPQENLSMDEPQAILITRPDLEVELRRIDPVQATFFKALLAGDELGAAVATAMEEDASFAPAHAMTLMLTTGLWQAVEISNKT